MGVKRGPDGVPIDVPSVMHEKSKGSGKPAGRSSLFGDDAATIPPPGARHGESEGQTLPPPSRPGGSLFPSDPPTVPAGVSPAAAKADPGRDDPPTVIAGGRAQSVPPAAAAATPSADPMADPVVGWLVVIEGPGKGSFLKLGNGQNSIGRGKDQRVCIDFGDDLISRQNHATVTYDPRGKNFYMQQGSGVNLAYLDDAPVLTVHSLKPLSKLSLGNTTLLFVPLCGENFSWN